MKFVKRIFIGLAIIICFSFGANIVNAGFGISPPTVLNQNLLPGSSYEQIIYIVRSTPDEALSAEAKINAGNATSWITIENGNKFEIPKGIQQFPMKVWVNVPSDAQLGDYKGTIELLTFSVSTTKQNVPVKVNLGAEIGVDLKVTNNELVDYNIQGLSIKDTEKNSPIILVVKIQNRGNGPAGPTKVDVVFYDIYHNTKLWEGSKDISEKAGSFSVRDVSVKLPNNLDLGQYWTDVEFFDGEKSVNKNKIVFTIIESQKEPGAKTDNGIMSPITKKYFLMGGIAVFVILLFLLLVWFVMRLFKNMRKNKKNETANHKKRITINKTNENKKT
jgi:hypothetical protein